ncbi:MAG: RAMP superfamily protein [Okeania sp. SIO3B5]|uniref:RAMP superfamily protein n=1 Tax=Okeania sp. SIO3B5 TaxID=2607811 RepID=UPI001401470F|nr:RAMP superfamily protein [Okeania sp. SIO3B5]NEO54058.1 RAMP superfamily protein [Okeania sp. SIO3B5]
MVKIPDAANKIPMMFRAQTAGRCQLQRILPERKKTKEPQDVEQWASEWIIKAYPTPPKFGGNVQSRRYTLTWRFVTNGGQDDGIIRPAIGAYGWPYYPGSSMKGIFRSVCSQTEIQRYCGSEESQGDCHPGILRFHGGYPTDSSWQDDLVDIVHPQQDWQVMKDKKSSGAFALISLSAPELEFGISSTIVLDDQEWEKIWLLWEKALSKGIGCRVSAGYGQVTGASSQVLYSCRLHGRGMAPKLLNGTGEFRPNMLRATIRSHALRIFGGLTDAKTAQNLVQELFGGVDGDGAVGLLGMKFETTSIKIGEFGKGAYAVPTYDVEGKLTWLLTRNENVSEAKIELLPKLIKGLTRFAMVFGGFGKSWRRADHRLFFPEYYDSDNDKPLIGCHWSWKGERSLLNDVRVRNLARVGEFIEKEVLQVAIDWMKLQQNVTLTPDNCAEWREAWHPKRVQVWGRLATEAEDCEAVRWLHEPYRQKLGRHIQEGSIYQSSVTGFVGRETQIGRLWHRMYPVVGLKKNPDNPNKPIIGKSRKFLELLTLFPDDSEEFEDFLHFLESEQKMFQLLWGDSRS